MFKFIRVCTSWDRNIIDFTQGDTNNITYHLHNFCGNSIRSRRFGRIKLINWHGSNTKELPGKFVKYLSYDFKLGCLYQILKYFLLC